MIKSIKALYNQTFNEYSFYQAIYLDRKDDYESSKQVINSLLNKTKMIFTIISEDYKRVITEFSKMSNLSMLLEVIRYKKMQHQSEMKDHWLEFIQISISQSYFSIAQSAVISIDEPFLNERKAGQ